MPTMSDLLGRQMQLGYVVSDIESAMRYWNECLNVGPWIYVKNSVAGRRFVHRGETSDIRMVVAFSYVGETQIELIMQTNAAPSIYTEFLASGREGIHHVAFWPADFDRACSSLIQSGSVELLEVFGTEGDKNVSYFSAPHHTGTLIEILKRTEARLRWFEGIKRLSDHWDGADPIRRFETRADFISTQCR
jgi:hypothetical protein